ncbi:MAG: cyanophycin synthetase [Candidatus Kaiserbacteria bacterium GW2011_GWA2_58_9]|uniref:Cyanophycin synthetase n=2 Tax=Candidatus Kaiseribacteriota TaxID=1752734 RepID=A0A0G1YV54_9BACT|nr:MAG: cyanophycin synthetase [Candidatus Kaiserbacteria bacterium GW2011_GWA2_58_9]
MPGIASAGAACKDVGMSKKAERLVLAGLLQKLAPRLGAKVVLESGWKIAGQITFPDRGGKRGNKSYFRYNTLDLNPVGASDIAKDKDYANFFMRKMGYPTVPGRAFYSDDWCETIGSRRNNAAAYRYARKLGFPVIVKPNEGSHGAGVFLVNDKREFMRAMRHIFKGDRVALVQRVVRGRDYRIVVLDRQVISAYERIPLSVVGDGRSSIKELLKRRQKRFRAASRDTRIRLDDIRIAHKLGVQKLALRSVPERGKQVFLLDNANLSSGGDAVDVTKPIHPEFKKIAVELTRDMGLRLCGVDLMVAGDIRQAPKKYRVLEVNAAPGLDHYVKQGRAQQKTVENLYLKVLKSLAR